MLKQNLGVFQSVGGKICNAVAANTGHKLLSRRNRQLLPRYDHISQLWRDCMKKLWDCSTIKSAFYRVENKDPKIYAFISQIMRQVSSLIC